MENQFLMAITAAKKALQKQIDANPNSGIIKDRGEPSEGKISNAEALETMESIWLYFSDKRKRAWEYCPNCGKHGGGQDVKR